MSYCTSRLSANALSVISFNLLSHLLLYKTCQGENIRRGDLIFNHMRRNVLSTKNKAKLLRQKYLQRQIISISGLMQ